MIDGRRQTDGPVPPRAVIAIIIGNWLEFFDFVVYTYFAVMIGQSFFPDSSQYGSILKSVAVFGAGFVTRPLGAAIIGSYADRAGRRPALVLTLVLMAVGTVMLGLVPPYAVIGPAAPILVLIARLVQGFAVGGELGPATSYLLETAAANKGARRTVWQSGGQVLATITGSAMGYVLAISLSHDALYAWGWRVPFLFGVLVAPIGLHIRRSLPETLTRESAAGMAAPAIDAGIEAEAGAEAGAGAGAGASLWMVLRDQRHTILHGVMIICGFTVSTYVSLYFTTYAMTTLKLSASASLLASLAGNVLGLCGLLSGAGLADRFRRKTVLVLGRVVFVAAIFPVYAWITRPSIDFGLLLALNGLLSFISAFASGGVFALLTEAFPRAQRSRGLSMLYAIGVTVFGATTQPVITWLLSAFHDPMMPAWYMIAAQFVSLAGILLIRSGLAR